MWSLFATSLISHGRFDLAGAGSRIRSGPRIARSRNVNIEAFKRSDAEWMWSLDTDMVWKPDALERLLEVAHWKDRPIVGGWCYAEYNDGRIRPTIYRVAESGQVVSIEMPADFKYDKVVACDATGAAFILIHRSVIEKMEDTYPPPHIWYQETVLPVIDDAPQDVGEDITFCLRARALGFPILVDARIRIGHVKAGVIDHEVYMQQQSAEAFLTEKEGS